MTTQVGRPNSDGEIRIRDAGGVGGQRYLKVGEIYVKPEHVAECEGFGWEKIGTINGLVLVSRS